MNNTGNAVEMETYTLHVHTEMVEVRKISAPKGLTFEELDAYADDHGYGDMVDCVDDSSELSYAEHADGTRVELAGVSDWRHGGVIGDADRRQAHADFVRERRYPENGWTLDGSPVSLTELIDLWAEQENECDPEDRGAFAWWILDHICDGRVIEPEVSGE